jgi:hypothetical protein
MKHGSVRPFHIRYRGPHERRSVSGKHDSPAFHQAIQESSHSLRQRPSFAARMIGEQHQFKVSAKATGRQVCRPDPDQDVLSTTE